MVNKINILEKYNGLLESSDRKSFTQNEESNIYTGINENGEEVHVYNQQGQGIIIKTRHITKPRFWECVEYDEDGWQQAVFYESYHE